MSERIRASVLPYSRPPSQSPLMRRLAAVPLVLALLGFPVGAATSMLMESLPAVFSLQVGERAGFMIFALMEGLAAAVGLVAATSLRREQPQPRGRYVIAASGAALGIIGSIVVLMLIPIHSIN